MAGSRQLVYPDSHYLLLSSAVILSEVQVLPQIQKRTSTPEKTLKAGSLGVTCERFLTSTTSNTSSSHFKPNPKLLSKAVDHLVQLSSGILPYIHADTRH